MLSYFKSLALGALLAVSSLATVAHATEPFGQISLRGVGTATGTPDMGEFHVTVVTIKPKLSDSLKDNNAITANVMKALKDAGVMANDVKTIDFQTDEHMVAKDDGRTYVREGFRVVNSLHVCVRDINKNSTRDVVKVGEALQAVVDVGGDNVRVGNLAFKASNEKAMIDLARKCAVEDARSKAELYAQAAGVKLGRIVEFGEQSAQAMPRAYTRSAMSDAPGNVPVAGGTHTVNVNVSIVWELEQPVQVK